MTTNQRTPKNASQPSEIGRNLSQSLQREHSPTHTLISDLWPPQLSKEYLSAILRYHQVMPQEMNIPRYKMMNKIPEFMKFSLSIKKKKKKKQVSGTRISNAKILFIALKCLKRQFPHDIFFCHILWMYT